jgi:hypothetical protein
MKRLNLPLVLGLSGLLMACPQKDDVGDDTGDSAAPTQVEVDGGGFACLVDDGTDDTSTGLIQVMLNECLSGCASDVNAGCIATVENGSIEVSAWGSYTVPTGPVVNCLAVCIELAAECEVSGLDASVTQLSYSDATVTIDFPASERTCTVEG